jgi:hypothetical protein
VRTESFNNPTRPVPGWILYGGLDIGYSLMLPPTWTAFDLNTQIDLAASSCTTDAPSRELRRQSVTSLHDRGVRLFACDTSRNADPHVPVAYGVTGQAPSDGLDKYLDRNSNMPQGREIVDRHHLATNAGDMVLQRVHERLTTPDGSPVDTMQYQFFVIRFNHLHLFFVEIPTILQDAIGKDAELMGSTLTPVR